VVEPGTELGVLHPLPVRRLWGVGPATERRLATLGVETVGDLAAIPEDTLVRTLGNASGHHLHALAWNRDERPVVPDQDVKSIGHEQTFPTDLHDHAALEHQLVGLADGVASRLRAAHAAARTVQLKVRFGDFTTITRSRTLAQPTDLAADVGRVARELLGSLEVGRGVRLLGISAQQLVRQEPARPSGTEPAPRSGAEGQGTLFADPDDDPDEPGATAASPAEERRQAALERSVDAVRARFGPGAVGSGLANSLPREGPGPLTR